MRPAWVTRQIAAFVRQFAGAPGEAWIGVDSLAGFEPVDRTRPSLRLMRDFGAGGRYELLPGLSLDNGFIWRPAGAEAEPELWLDPTVSGYRATFERFANRFLGASGLSSANVQIDHVFPKKAGSLDGLAYVRMLAIPPDSNMAAGRTVERAMADRARARGNGKLVRHATYVSIGKATGYSGWDSLPNSTDASANQPAVRGLFAHLRTFGLPPDVLSDLDQTLTAGRLRSLK